MGVRGALPPLALGVLSAACSGATRPSDHAADPADAADAGAPSSVLTEVGWIDETSERGLSGVVTTCRNASFGDLDGDGAPELVVPDASGIMLFHNDGAGHFEPWKTLPVGPVVDVAMQECSLALGDLDGDGRLDLAVGLDEPEHPVGVFFNDGQGAFTATYAQIEPPQPKLQTFALGIASGTGTSPVLFACEQIVGAASRVRYDQCGYDARGINVECHTQIDVPTAFAWNVAGRTLRPSTDPALALVGQTQALGITDFDGDGRDDLLVATDFATQNALRGGPSTFSNVSTSWGLGLFAHGMGWALGDSDGDGRTDAVLSTIGGFVEWQGLGAAGFRARGDASVYATRRRNIWPWALVLEDLDNNGFMDLLSINVYASPSPIEPVQWIQSIGGPGDFVGAFDTIIFRNGPTSYEESILPYDAVLPHSARGRSVSMADLDGDGVLELALPVTAYGSTKNAIAVGRLAGRPIGHGLTVRFSGRAVPPGTTIELSCAGREQVRTLYATEGGGSAARREAHFGCGAATSYERLRVTLPGDVPREMRSGPLDRSVTVRARSRPCPDDLPSVLRP